MLAKLVNEKGENVGVLNDVTAESLAPGSRIVSADGSSWCVGSVTFDRDICVTVKPFVAESRQAPPVAPAPSPTPSAFGAFVDDLGPGNDRAEALTASESVATVDALIAIEAHRRAQPKETPAVGDYSAFTEDEPKPAAVAENVFDGELASRPVYPASLLVD